MANTKLKDEGSRKHVLDLLKKQDHRLLIDNLISRSGFRLAKHPLLQPYGRQCIDDWTEFEIEEYLHDPARQLQELPPIADNWWLAHKTENNSRPTWDLIGHLSNDEGTPGILLVEAKANVGELNPKDGMSKSTGSRKSDANEKRIKKRIKQTQPILNKLNKSKIKLPFDNHYQLVNRLAYSCQLGSLGYNVVLLYLGFCQDTYFKRPILNDRHWQRVIGGYCNGVIAQSFPEIEHKFEGDGSLQMLIGTLPVMSISEKTKTKKA